jgi:hypothetical protein
VRSYPLMAPLADVSSSEQEIDRRVLVLNQIKMLCMVRRFERNLAMSKIAERPFIMDKVGSFHLLLLLV